MHKIGIIQGRLSPARGNRIQSFPWSTWQEEFKKAREVGLDCVEFIFDSEDFQNNPLWLKEGRDNLKTLVAQTGVAVYQVCADYFMEQPFVRVSEEQRKQSVAVLRELIAASADAGIAGIEIPLVDNSRIENEQDKNAVIKSLGEALPTASKYKIEIGLETSLPPQSLKALLEEINHPLMRVTYDIGNSASLGYDTHEEIIAIKPWINNVHVKDRLLGGATVPLGSGNANFEKTFSTLRQIKYHGAFVLQAAREPGSELETARANRNFIEQLLKLHFN